MLEQPELICSPGQLLRQSSGHSPETSKTFISTTPFSTKGKISSWLKRLKSSSISSIKETGDSKLTMILKMAWARS